MFFENYISVNLILPLVLNSILNSLCDHSNNKLSTVSHFFLSNAMNTISYENRMPISTCTG